jgi:hypothetical protein
MNSAKKDAKEAQRLIDRKAKLAGRAERKAERAERKAAKQAQSPWFRP